jgi:uncharacterized protein YbaP (TraB family)
LKKLLFILLFSSFIQAQNKSLFWEISGNGLSKNSYLYGTMHVNDKISFNLSDSFFKNLLGSDIVANESDPETWPDLNELMKNNTNYNSYIQFYAEFYLLPATKEQIKTIFNNDNARFFSSILSGAEGEQADFQENSVLDTFIFQTGKKYKKRVVGLEDAKESIVSILQIDDHAARPKDENKLALMKILKNKNLNESIKEYYRENDIVMLDSIYKLIYSKKAHDALIVNRNKIMVNSIDSIAKTGSLFSAVGAAHLAGNEGMIELLRRKGYTVNPIIDVFTENGKKQKKTIEAYFPNPGFIASSTKDKMVQIPLYKSTIEENSILASPDFMNGGAISIKRIPLNYFLKNKDILYNAKSLDSLFFERIAGDIIEKKYFEQANYSGYDIKNITKTGNSQHSRFYITPLEIISVSMTGPANYVRQYENEVFENIKIKPFKNEWEKIKPVKGGFEVDVPSFNLVIGNNPEKRANIDIQAYDNQEKGYYFLRKKTLNDTEILENSEYEQKQLHYQFYLQQNQDSTHTYYNKARNTFVSSSKGGERNVKLKTFVKGNKYYLLGTVNASETNSDRFFDSFSITAFDYKSKSKIFTDSIANYKIEIPEKENELLFLNLKTKQYEAKNTFRVVDQFQTFNSETGKIINLHYHKYHKYEPNLPIDSIQKRFRKVFLKEFEKEFDEDFQEDYYTGEDEYGTTNSLLDVELYRKKGFSKSLWNKFLSDKKDKYEFIDENAFLNKEDSTYILNAVVSKPNAVQAIKYKALYKNNTYYLLSTLVEKNYRNDDFFIENAFNSLALAKNTTTDNEKDKIKLFIEDAKSEKDTIRYSALQSINMLEIKEKDFEHITSFINSFNFKDNETDAVAALLEQLGKISDTRVIPFLEHYYKKETTKTAIQISILKSLAHQKSKAGYKKINELLEYDLPLSDNPYEINSLFYSFQNDPENSKELFPEIFQYYSIKEYNKPIIDFCNLLLEKKLISVNKIKAFKKIILTNTKLEYKRVASWNQKNKANEDPEEVLNFYVEPTESLPHLINYTNLIYNYANETAVKELIKKIQKLDIAEVNTELARLGIIHNNLTNSEIQVFLNDPKTQFPTINLLLNQNRKELINFTDQQIAKSAVINFQNVSQNDSIALLKKKVIEKNEKEISVYFYEITKKKAEMGMDKKLLFTVAFINEDKKINPLAFKTFNMVSISDDDDLEKKYNVIINEFLNENHPRASFEKVPVTNDLFTDEGY